MYSNIGKAKHVLVRAYFMRFLFFPVYFFYSYTNIYISFCHATCKCIQKLSYILMQHILFYDEEIHTHTHKRSLYIECFSVFCIIKRKQFTLCIKFFMMKLLSEHLGNVQVLINLNMAIVTFLNFYYILHKIKY